MTDEITVTIGTTTSSIFFIIIITLLPLLLLVLCYYFTGYLPTVPTYCKHQTLNPEKEEIICKGQ